MSFFRVKNFEAFQHYKDRSPPWIKFYGAMLDDYDIGRLPDASKAHLFAIWLLASRYSNRIPYDAEWVARRINATGPVDLDSLAEAGFIIAEQPRSNMLASRKQDACLETETETETETEGEKKEVMRAVARRTPLVDLSTWNPGEPENRYAEEHNLDPGRVLLDIRAWCANAPASKRRKRDPTQFWQTWCRREADKAPTRRPSTRSQEQADAVRQAVAEFSEFVHAGDHREDRQGNHAALPAPDRREDP